MWHKSQQKRVAPAQAQEVAAATVTKFREHQLLGQLYQAVRHVMLVPSGVHIALFPKLSTSHFPIPTPLRIRIRFHLHACLQILNHLQLPWTILEHDPWPSSGLESGRVFRLLWQDATASAPKRIQGHKSVRTWKIIMRKALKGPQTCETYTILFSGCTLSTWDCPYCVCTTRISK